MKKTILVSLACCLSVAAGPARAAEKGALAAEGPKAPQKIVLRTGFYTTAALDCAFDVSMSQDASQVVVAYRSNPESGASCSVFEGESLTLSIDKNDPGQYVGELRTQYGNTSDLAVKPINEESFLADGHLYTLAKAAVAAASAPPQLCPYVHMEMRIDSRCHSIGNSIFEIHCGWVEEPTTKMVPCDQIPR